MTDQPDSGAALEFLQRWAPEGPWVLTAIQTDRKGISTRTFRPASVGSMMQWLEANNGQRNIYFHVNEPIRDLDKKADREDIGRVTWLHVDIDPRAGEDLEAEQQRALSLLTERLPGGVPDPTCIIFSGGGYQAFWRLEEPLEIDGDLARAEAAKQYNMQLELLFAADNCHNIDRIMRLPGTVNIPDARKAKKGRVRVTARVVRWLDVAYPIGQFARAPSVELKEATGFGGAGGMPVKVSGNVVRVNDASELDQWDVPDRVKIIMAQGRHPDFPKEGDDSRSAWLFDFCCSLIRHGVPDETIFGIITDPEWGIAESVVELKGNAEKYALRQISRAREHAVDPWLAYFNERYAVIKNLGGRCLVVTEIYDFGLGRHRLSRITFEALASAYRNKLVRVGEDANGNPKWRKAGDWWLDHLNRREYNTLTFAPEKAVPADIYNMWRGFAFPALPGDCSLFLDHVREGICGGSEEYYRYVMGWMARTVQHPAESGQVALVLRGGRGVGKSVFAEVFGRLFGRHYLQVSNSAHLVGNFNSHLRDLIVLFADEAFYAQDKRHQSILKTLVTEPTMAIEAKGVDVEPAPNYIHLIMASNDPHVIPAGGDERRYCVLDTSQRRQRDTGYFAAMMRQLNEGGYSALLHTLRQWDLTSFDVRDVPTTNALREQKLLSLQPEEEWWYGKMQDGNLLSERNGWPGEVVARELTDDFIEHLKRFNVLRRGNQVTLGKFLARVCPGLRHKRRMVDIHKMTGDGYTRTVKRREPVLIMPSLTACRDQWGLMFGAEEWDTEQEELPSIREQTPF